MGTKHKATITLPPDADPDIKPDIKGKSSPRTGKKPGILDSFVATRIAESARLAEKTRLEHETIRLQHQAVVAKTQAKAHQAREALEFKAREANATREHDILMMERKSQLQIEQLQLQLRIAELQQQQQQRGGALHLSQQHTQFPGDDNSSGSRGLPGGGGFYNFD